MDEDSRVTKGLVDVIHKFREKVEDYDEAAGGQARLVRGRHYLKGGQAQTAEGDCLSGNAIPASKGWFCSHG